MGTERCNYLIKRTKLLIKKIKIKIEAKQKVKTKEQQVEKI